MDLSKLLRSSADANKLSLTVKGALIAAIPIVIGLVSLLFGVQLEVVDLSELANQVASLISLLGAVVSAVMVIVGIGRKIFLQLKK